MTEPETVVCGRMLLDGELGYGEVGIAGGKIVSAGKYVSGGERRIDLGSSETLLPGFMDPHVHLRDPGMTQKEDFSTGTAAALYGGVTCVLDMPNTKPPVTDLDSLMGKKATVRGRSYVDYGLFAAVTRNLPAALLAPHVPGFKLFMGSTTGNILVNDDDEIAAAMEQIAPTGKVVSVHAEDDDLINHDEYEKSCQDHLRDRPVEAEYSALRRLAKFAQTNRINICHCTNAPQVESASGLGFTTEVTMHHLLFDAGRNTSAFYKVNPPIRDRNTRDGLKMAFLDGKITMFGSDHAPHTLDEKSGDFDEAPGGIPGVETTVPMAMAMVADGTIGMTQAVKMGAENPGRVFSAPKGRIAPGCDADFSIFDLRKVTQIDQKRLHSKCGFSPYHGMRAVFPDTVIIRGQVLLKDGELAGEPLGKDICG